MKKFNKYILSKNDKQIIKNFSRSTDYKKLGTGNTKDTEELDKYWLRILETSNKAVLKKLYKHLRDMHGYITIINSTEYFICDYYDKNFYNIFCYNMSSNEIINLSNSKEHIDLFRIICDIVIVECNKGYNISYKIKLSSTNTKLYFKLIDKIMRLRYKQSEFILKKIKRDYYYYYKGICHKPTIKYLRSRCHSYKKPFVIPENIITKLKHTKAK